MKDSVIYEIKSLEHLIFRNFFFKDCPSETIMKNIPTPTQMMILDYIINSKEDYVFQKDLEQVFGLRRATISGVLHTMEKNNLIVRSIFENDTRVKIVKLSAKTKSIFESNRDRLQELEKVIVRGIDKNKMKIFLNVINEMKENIKCL